MFQRLANERLWALHDQFAAVAIFGARQVGKTTLARQAFPEATYVDLEDPSQRERFTTDTRFAVESLGGGCVVFDEAQLVPALFSVLRGLIDARPAPPARFILLGSAQPNLVRAVSETLAGRIGFLELDPLVTAEVAGIAGETSDAWPRLWIAGGMPGALAGTFREWWLAYWQTYVERDLVRLGLTTDPLLLRRLATMLAHQQGGLLNHSALGAALGVSSHTVQRYLDLLEGTFLLRRLRPYHANVGKRLVKAPRAYLRDTGLLHHLLNLNDADAVRSHPVAGASWETFILEDVIRRTRLRDPFAEFFFWRTSDGHEADLLIERGGRADVLIEVKLGSGRAGTAAAKLEKIRGQLGARRACIVGAESGREPMSAGVERLGPAEALRETF